MQGATVLAGSTGLTRRVRGINIIEVPDVSQWLEGGELLLSAGYAWRDDPERMVGLAGRLHQLHVSGIAFKLGAYLESVPPELLKEADELALPVLQLPPDVAYREVLESLYGNLASRRGVFDLSRRARQAFIHSSLDEQSVEKVVGTLARQLRCDTSVVDLLDESIVTSRAGEAAVRTRFDELGEPAAALVIDLAGQQLRRSPSEASLDGRRALGAALVVGHRTQGYLLAFTDEPFDDTAIEAVAHAGELVSFLLMNRLALFEGRREAGDVFLQSLISDTLTTEEAAERAVTLGLRLTRPCMVFVLGSLGPQPREHSLDVVARRLDRMLAGSPRVFGSGPRGETVIGVVQADEPHEPLFERFLDVLDAVHTTGVLPLPIIGAGTPGVGVDGVRRSRSEALIAFETGRRLKLHGLFPFSRLGVERLLSQIPRGPVVEDYVESLLGPLDDDPELLRTVEIFLQHGGNKVATAAAIPLHRSSLVYRLHKASAMLGIDLNSPEACLEVWLAIRLRRMLDQ